MSFSNHKKYFTIKSVQIKCAINRIHYEAQRVTELTTIKNI